MRLLCSPPAYLDMTHLLNEWMRYDETVDTSRAVRQWERLVAVLEEAGADVLVLPPHRTTPAMTFTRDLGVLVDGALTTLTNLGPRGEKEPRRLRRFLRTQGITATARPRAELLEGGNVVHSTWGWLVGVRGNVDATSTRAFAADLRAATREQAAVVPLPDHRFGHLDMVLADLGPLWLAYPPALEMAGWGDARWEAILGGRPVIEVDDDEVGRLAANVVRVGDTVVGDMSARMCRAVEAAGLAAAPVELDEMRKAGGGAHCLTLELPDPTTTAPAAAPTTDLRSARAGR